MVIIILSLVVAVAATIVTADRACQPLADCLFPLDCQVCDAGDPPPADLPVRR